MNFEIKKPSTVTVVFEPQKLPFTFKVHKDGQLYFFRKLSKGQEKINFNLKHSGSYQSNEGTIVSIDKMTIKPLGFSVPLPQRIGREKPITIQYNPILTKEFGTPARHFTGKGLIEVGDFFKSLPFPIRYFVLLHEYAHFFYKDESYCDLWAAKRFVENGYNRSTALYALTDVLKNTDENIKRILTLNRNLL